MSSLAFTPMAYRHVVFPDAPEPNGRAVNFMPQPADRDRAPAAREEDLTSDEQSSIERLFDRVGLCLTDYRLETLKRRIPSCLRAMRVESVGRIGPAIDRQPDLLKTALSTLVIGVTSFFRDPGVFAALEKSFLPEVLRRTPNPRIWSAGCSDGAELYSLAMLLAEWGAVQRSTLLGTDCRTDAVARAREGCYDAGAIKGVPARFVGRYLTPDGAMWQIHPFLRAAAQWRFGNVLYTSEPGAWDLILCRNMAIYLQPEAAGRLWARLGASLRPGGILVTGKAERPYGATGMVAVAPCIYQRDRS
jgi:chemotaxis methyl-accepting protein methylase